MQVVFRAGLTVLIATKVAKAIDRQGALYLHPHPHPRPFPTVEHGTIKLRVIEPHC